MSRMAGDGRRAARRPRVASRTGSGANAARYVEWEAISNYSFLRGASHPEELVRRAANLGLEALGVADHDTLAGVVRVHAAARAAGLRSFVGARLDLADAPSVLAYPCGRAAYGRLSRLLTEAKARAGGGARNRNRNAGRAGDGLEGEGGSGEGAGNRALRAADLLAVAERMVLIVLPPDRPAPELAPLLSSWRAAFRGQVWLALRRGLASPPNDAREERAVRAARSAGVPLVATNAVLMHQAERRPVADVLACLRTGRGIDEMGLDLLKNAERRLKSPVEMARLFRDRPETVEATLDIAGRIGFSLDQLRLDYPDEAGPDGRPAMARLERAVREGARERYPSGVPAPVESQLERELAIIARLGYAPYFLTVYDLVRFARSQGILAQGRGSAANSAVCYVLGITAVDPARSDLLFERFVSEERGEPPDIDVDFEHERREEVIQHVYERWGRHRAALTATVIHFRARLALREAGKALGLSEEVTSVLAARGGGGEIPDDEAVRALGLDPGAPRLRHALAVARTLVGFPRHLSQHPGGFVIGQGRLDEVVPIGPAAMPGRTVIEWDKDDLEALGILKVDVLGLGMLSCLRKGFELLANHHGRRLDLDGIPPEDPAVYDMLGRADSLGVFQVESRAQMSFLPRMKPRTFYDLVIEVAIVRPGPIQGGMVHPYLRRRNGREEVRYPLPELEPVLGKTRGVPIFQEQAMRIAIIGAGFTPEEADGLRRAMATFRRVGTLPQYRRRFLERLAARGCPPEFAEQCWNQIEGFGEYGFPESHAASFAILVYASAWLKCHYPDVFACALLNSQPMGFYAPSQIVRDAREHGVEVRPVDVNASEWDCTLEPAPGGGYALRLGFRLVKGLGEEAGRRLVAARGNGYREAGDVPGRTGLGERAMSALAAAAAFGSLDLGRREGWWTVERVKGRPLPLFAAAGEPDRGPDPPVALPPATPGEELAADYRSVGLSLRGHPVALLREAVGAGVTWSGTLGGVRSGARVAVTGVVLVRQRPRTAKGVIFLTLEDMEGIVNVVVWSRVFRRFRVEVQGARLMRVEGRVESSESVVHVIAERVVDLTQWLEHLADGAVEGQGTAALPGESGGSSPASGSTASSRRHPRHEARRLFPSRDFH